MPSLSEDYSLLQNGVGLIVLPDAILRFKGPDVREFFQGAISNDIKQLKKGQGLAAFHLTPKGKWVAALKLFEKEEGVWGITSAPESKVLQESLKTLLFFSQTELKDVSNDFVWIRIVGEKAVAFSSEFLQVRPDSGPLSHQTVLLEGIALEVLRDFDWTYPAFLLLAPRQDLERVKSALTATPSTYPVKWIEEKTNELLRIEAGLPTFGIDVDEKTIPPEANLDEAYISYTKGCYVGQETISRVKHYGKVNRRLARLRVNSPEALPKESAVIYEGKEVGRITSMAFSPQSENVVALAMLPREAAEKGKVLKVKTTDGEFEATVV